jgi:hypothetical protein
MILDRRGRQGCFLSPLSGALDFLFRLDPTAGAVGYLVPPLTGLITSFRTRRHHNIHNFLVS